MPPSQLKRLKESLREEGLVGPQQSKKQKQKAKGNGSNHDWKVQRQNAIRGRREQCNPFEVQHMSRGREKFEVIDSRTEQGKGAKTIKGRPGVTKGLGEENVRLFVNYIQAFS
jgi:nucleolar protein 14